MKLGILVSFFFLPSSPSWLLARRFQQQEGVTGGSEKIEG
jgi:hypothetical protein